MTKMLIGTKKQRITIKDVAREAGVALSTASNALAGKHHVREETRIRVQAVAARLGFRASMVAQAMRSRRTHTLGVLLADVSNPSSPDFLRGIEDVATEARINLLLCNTDGDEKKQIAHMETLIERQVDGLILLSQHCESPAIRELLDSGTPFVHIQRKTATHADDYVVADNWESVTSAIRHLVELGHKRVAFIRGPELSSTVQERLSAFRECARLYGIDDDPTLVFAGDYGLEWGVAAIRYYLDMERPPTAILASNDMCALGVFEVAVELSISIPKDLSLIGYDDIAFASLKTFNLSTIRLQKREMGAAAARLLLKRIRAKRRLPQQSLVFPIQFVPRGTTGPAAVATKSRLIAADCTPPARTACAPASRRRTRPVSAK